jgi:hypothetical protein
MLLSTVQPPGGSQSATAALARSGIMALTGWPDGPPVLPPLDLPARLAGLVAGIEELTALRGRPVRVSWEAALAGRAALLGLRRLGRTSANGTCRLLRAPDGWVALNLPRRDDIEMIPALTGRVGPDPWDDAGAMLATAPAAEFVARARLLGLAAAQVPEPGRPALADAARETQRWERGDVTYRPWRVVDLSSLWAGPLVARLLAEAGARVTRIESRTRPDGARAIPKFYRWLHSPGETTVEVDLRSAAGRQHAADLIDGADVVIEASRPRALEQLGLGPEDRRDRPGRVWLSITGYGRSAPGRDWVAFGDDAAVAGGLLGWDEADEPVFCGDAIADPVAGLVGALAVLQARQTGGGQLIDLAMSRAAAFAAGDTGRRVTPAAAAATPVRDGPPSLDLIQPGTP